MTPKYLFILKIAISESLSASLRESHCMYANLENQSTSDVTIRVEEAVKQGKDLSINHT
jgi:hypothetical protein